MESAGRHARPAARPAAATQPASERVRLRRKRERGSHDRAVIDAILDEALIAHLGIADEDGQPFVIPTLHARCGDVVYCHGSRPSRTLRALARGRAGVPDGVADRRARAGALGDAPLGQLPLGDAARRRPRRVDEPEEKLAALRAIVEHIVPGRWRDVRPPTDNELKATAVLAIPIEEASAKVRTGPPLDDEEDYALAGLGGRDPADRRGAGARSRTRGCARASQAPRLRDRLPAPGRRVTAQIGGGVHRAPARRLHLEQLEHAGRAVEQQTRRVRAPGSARSPRRRARRARRRRPLARQRRARARPAASRRRAPRARRCAGAARARRARARRRAAAGSSRRSAGADLLGVGDALLGLLDERRALLERAHEQLAAELLQARGERADSCRRAGSARRLPGTRARCRGRRSGA